VRAEAGEGTAVAPVPAAATQRDALDAQTVNDGPAFPFVVAAVALAAAGESWTGGWLTHWAWSDVLVRVGVGVAAGIAIGLLLGRVLFRARAKSLRLAEHGEGFVALAAMFLSYGVTEALHGYGFLAVFATACALRRRLPSRPTARRGPPTAAPPATF